FTDGHPTPGIMLRDHYRCLPEIIGYCDELAYEGLLRPVRGSARNSPFPAMGYAHIRGHAEKIAKSWHNTLEAHTIADWLQQNHDDILNGAHKGPEEKKKSIEKIVEIVTPYRSQAPVLKSAIKEKLSLKEEQMKNFTINTVHALQGAERDMVIFSPAVKAHGD